MQWTVSSHNFNMLIGVWYGCISTGVYFSINHILKHSGTKMTGLSIETSALFFELIVMWDLPNGTRHSLVGPRPSSYWGCMPQYSLSLPCSMVFT